MDNQTKVNTNAFISALFKNLTISSDSIVNIDLEAEVNIDSDSLVTIDGGTLSISGSDSTLSMESAKLSIENGGVVTLTGGQLVNYGDSMEVIGSDSSLTISEGGELINSDSCSIIINGGPLVIDNETFTNNDPIMYVPSVYIEICNGLLRVVTISTTGKKIIKDDVTISKIDDSCKFVYDKINFAIIKQTNSTTMNITTLQDSILVSRDVQIINSPIYFNAEMRDGDLYWWYFQFDVASFSNYPKDQENRSDCIFATYKNFDVISKTNIGSAIDASINNFNEHGANILENVPYESLIQQYTNQFTTVNATQNCVQTYAYNAKWGDTKIYKNVVSAQLAHVIPFRFYGINNISGGTSCSIYGVDFDNKTAIINQKTSIDSEADFGCTGANVILTNADGSSFFDTYPGCESRSCDQYVRCELLKIGTSTEKLSGWEAYQAAFLVGGELSSKFSVSGINLYQTHDAVTSEYLYTQGNIVGPFPEIPNNLTTKVKISAKYSFVVPQIFGDTINSLHLIDNDTSTVYDLTNFINVLGNPRNQNVQMLTVCDINSNNMLIYSGNTRKTFVYNKTLVTLMQIDDAALQNLQLTKIPIATANKFIRQMQGLD